jgi:hypothetical protein
LVNERERDKKKREREFKGEEKSPVGMREH